MGKHFWIKHVDDEFEDRHPGCMSGIINAFDYHYWHSNVKRMLPHHINNKGRNVKGNDSCPLVRFNATDSGEVQKLLDDEASHFFADQSSTKSSLTNKRSIKARIKALIAEEVCKEDGRKKRGPGFPAGSRLQRTYSIHHLEPSDLGLSEICTDLKSPIIFLQNSVDKSDPKLVSCNKKFDSCKTKDAVDYMEHCWIAEDYRGSTEECDEAKETPGSKNASLQHSKKYSDVLEIFKVNKELFLKISQDTDDGIGDCFQSMQYSYMRAKLTKSGTFPVADFSNRRNFGPSKLKHKLQEIWSVPKGKKSLDDTQVQKFDTSQFSELFRTNSGPLMVKASGGTVLNQETSSLSLSSARGNEFSPSSGEKDVTERCEVSTTSGDGRDCSSSCFESDGSIYDLTNRTFTHRRTSSLNESLDKYARLFEYTLSRESDWHKSRSLKLRNESEIPSNGHIPVSFRRIRSLSHGDSYCFHQNEVRHDVESSDDSSRMEHLARLRIGTDEKGTATIDGLNEEVDEPAVEKSNSHKESDTNFKEFDDNEVPHPTLLSVCESCVHEVTSSSDIPISEGLERRCNSLDENESSLYSHNKFNTDFLSLPCSLVNPENFEKENKIVINHRHIELPMKDDAHLNYVRVILEQSGIIENGFLETWQSSEHPIDPSVLEDVEACWSEEQECSNEDIVAFCLRHNLFDLVNEVLLQIFDRSFTYYPKALSTTCRVRPMPLGNRILEEVWASVSRYLNLKPEMHRTLDCVVSRDFANDDGWMNFQLESECVALELEDIIFEELLEEIIYS